MDVYSTILDYAGGAPDPDLPSRSFASLLRGQDAPDWGEDAVYSEQEETRVIRTPGWAYFKRFSHDGAPDLPDELFNTADDPGETVNLANDPTRAAIAADLSARIDAYFERHVRTEADLWAGGQPIQNSMMSAYWRDIWGEDWAPVYRYGA
jgi:arylsulfatase A-like enzyme